MVRFPLYPCTCKIKHRHFPIVRRNVRVGGRIEYVAMCPACNASAKPSEVSRDEAYKNWNESERIQKGVKDLIIPSNISFATVGEMKQIFPFLAKYILCGTCPVGCSEEDLKLISCPEALFTYCINKLYGVEEESNV